MVCLNLVKKFNINMKQEISVDEEAASQIGTSARLRGGDCLTLKDLLYGMMLPSGNDAAWALAIHFGKILFKHLKKRNRKKKKEKRNYMVYFLHEMNRQAQKLKMFSTHFANPHGLVNQANKSTSYDIALLCWNMMKQPFFTQIVGTKRYVGRILDAQGDVRQKLWQNTHKLLFKGYKGIKTGWTCRAGGCLSSCFQGKRFQIVIVLLNSQSKELRFTETEFLYTYFKSLFQKNEIKKQILTFFSGYK